MNSLLVVPQKTTRDGLVPSCPGPSYTDESQKEGKNAAGEREEGIGRRREEERGKKEGAERGREG